MSSAADDPRLGTLREAIHDRRAVRLRCIADQPWPEAVVRFDPSVERWARERQPFVCCARSGTRMARASSTQCATSVSC